MAYFPLFIDLTDANCLVIGEDEAVYEKSQILSDFGAKVSVVSKEDYTPFILQERALVVASTGDSKLNGEIAAMCKEGNIPVNIIGEPEKSSFTFPTYIKEQNLVGAFSSSGNSPALTQYLKNREKEILTPKLGELNEMLGRWRTPIIELFPLEASRNSAFEQLIDYALCYDGIPTDEEVEELLMSISMAL